MKDILQDVVAHTHALGFLSLVKVTNDNESTIVEAMADDRSVILSATTTHRVADGTFGMPNLDKLALHLKNPEYQKDAKIDVVTAERNGEVVPSELAFSMKGVFDSTYRVIVSEMVDAQIKTANFKGAKWDVEVMPSSKAVKDLQTFAGILGSYDPLFTVKTEGNDLMFHIGDASTDKLSLKFASNVDGTLSTGWSFPLSTVLTILKLGDTSSMSIKISDQGAMAIHVDSGMGLYEYILPAKSGN